MARIARSEYSKIQQMVSAEGRKVAEIAGLYGCSPANIYAILARLRREGVGVPADAPELVPAPTSSADIAAPPEGPTRPKPVSATPGDLFASEGHGSAWAKQPETISEFSEPQHGPKPESTIAATQQDEVTSAGPSEVTVLRSAGTEARPAAAAPPAPAGSAARTSATASMASVRPAKASKPGFALHMRTAEGDESSTPFRSLDDLLSAAKPILRTAARSPDTIWFSIQPVDLADVDSEAA